jgi:hypothetical protein
MEQCAGWERNGAEAFRNSPGRLKAVGRAPWQSLEGKAVAVTASRKMQRDLCEGSCARAAFAGAWPPTMIGSVVLTVAWFGSLMWLLVRMILAVV